VFGNTLYRQVESTINGNFQIITITFWAVSIALSLKHDVSDTGFCLRLQVDPTPVGPTERVSPCLRIPGDNVNICDNCITIVSSKAYGSCSLSFSHVPVTNLNFRTWSHECVWTCLSTTVHRAHNMTCLWTKDNPVHDMTCLRTIVYPGHNMTCLRATDNPAHNMTCLRTTDNPAHNMTCLRTIVPPVHNMTCLSRTVHPVHNITCLWDAAVVLVRLIRIHIRLFTPSSNVHEQPSKYSDGFRIIDG
jgi:hypothetical protein